MQSTTAVMASTTPSHLPSYYPEFSQPEYAGLAALINGPERPPAVDVEEDIEGEQETLPDLVSGDDINPDIRSSGPDISLPELEKTVAGISKGVTDATEREYLRYAASIIFANALTPSHYCLSPF